MLVGASFVQQEQEQEQQSGVMARWGCCNMVHPPSYNIQRNTMQSSAIRWNPVQYNAIQRGESSFLDRFRPSLSLSDRFLPRPGVSLYALITICHTYASKYIFASFLGVIAQLLHVEKSAFYEWIVNIEHSYFDAWLLSGWLKALNSLLGFPDCELNRRTEGESQWGFTVKSPQAMVAHTQST